MPTTIVQVVNCPCCGGSTGGGCTFCSGTGSYGGSLPTTLHATFSFNYWDVISAAPCPWCDCINIGTQYVISNSGSAGVGPMAGPIPPPSYTGGAFAPPSLSIIDQITFRLDWDSTYVIRHPTTRDIVRTGAWVYKVFDCSGYWAFIITFYCLADVMWMVLQWLDSPAVYGSTGTGTGTGTDEGIDGDPIGTPYGVVYATTTINSGVQDNSDPTPISSHNDCDPAFIVFGQPDVGLLTFIDSSIYTVWYTTTKFTGTPPDQTVSGNVIPAIGFSPPVLLCNPTSLCAMVTA